jgi:L-rhamnose-H+ transport protein
MFALPLRIRKRYGVENTLLVAMGFATIVLPTIFVTIVFPQWPKAISQGGSTVFMVAAMGFGWGCGSVTFAKGINALGLGIGYPVIMGLSTVIGSIIPMATKWSEINPQARICTLIGTLVCLAGVVIIGKAGDLREKSSAAAEAGGSSEAAKTAAKAAGAAFVVGILWCVLSGVLSPCANLGYHFAEPIGTAADNMGVNPLFGTVPRWMPMYWGGYLAILIFMGSALAKNKTVANFSGQFAGRDFLLAIMMGALHFLAQIPYGMGAHFLGSLGTSAGWVVNIASSIVVAAVVGSLTGEWRKASRAAFGWRNAGLAVLILAMFVLGYANSLNA